MSKIKHPAKYTDCLLPVFSEFLKLDGAKTVLDPMAGTGKIHLLPFDTYGVEIEKEWADLHEKTICADATSLPFESNSFDAICTSPTYGNRMADCHNAKDASKRNTYTHVLGKNLKDNNTGKMQWGEKYRNFHEKIWEDCYRVLKRDGCLILNFKNHIRKGIEVDVFSWHISCLISLGFKLREVRRIKVKGNRFGQNGKKRIDYEFIALFNKG